MPHYGRPWSWRWLRPSLRGPPSRPKRAPPPRLQSAGSTRVSRLACENHGVTPAYELLGTGPDLVLIPGTFADRRTWSRVVGRLSSRVRCLLLDPRRTHETPD